MIKKTTLGLWKTLSIGKKPFSGCFVEVGGSKFPLRPDQIKELVKWSEGGKFDSEWLVVKKGIPAHFLSQQGDINVLYLPENEPLKTATKKSKATASPPLAPPAKKKKEEKKKGTPVKKKDNKQSTQRMPEAKLSGDKKMPLTGHTMVFSGKFAGRNRKECEALARALGAKTAGSLSGKTTILVCGAKPGDKEFDAHRQGVPVWTEGEFDTVAGGGAAPVGAPIPAWAIPIAENTKLAMDARMALISYLAFAHLNPSGTHGHLHFHAQVAKGSFPVVGKYGAACLKGAIVAYQGQCLMLNDPQELELADVADLCDAVLQNAAESPKPITTWNIARNNLGDVAVQIIAQCLPRTKLEALYLFDNDITVVSARALVDAVKKCPSLTRVEIDGDSQTLKVLAAHNATGAKCKFMVNNTYL